MAPFMAVTAHWIEIRDQRTSRGTEKCMVFCSELVAFHRVPGRHTGEHLAAALLHVLDRVKMTPKVGAPLPLPPTNTGGYN